MISNNTWSNIYSTDAYSTISDTTAIDFSMQTTASYSDLLIGGHSMLEFIKSVEERLLIIQPDPDKLKKFEALRIAYDNYKLVEALLHDN